MSKTVKRLFGISLALVVAASASFYFGPKYELSRFPAGETPCDHCVFDVGIGDRWFYLGGFLCIIALAIIMAAFKLWMEERRKTETVTSII
jgi:hypothetical protein